MPSDGNPAGLTRRRLLKGAAGLAAAAALMPPNVRRALAQPDRGGLRATSSTSCMLMQENRSFDHYFGTLAGVRGFDDPRRAEAARRPFRVSISRTRRIPNGYLLPFHLDTACEQRAEDSFHQPRLGGAARGLEWRPDGSMAAGASQGGRRERPVRHGLLHARGHSVPVRAGRGVHDLRCLPLLGVGPDVAESHVSG